MPASIQEVQFDTADELWRHFDSSNLPREETDELMYRGHADASWQLVPTILRSEWANHLNALLSRVPFAEDQVWVEFQLLRSFISACDQAGVAIPADSRLFRKRNLTNEAFRPFFEYPSSWPSDMLLEIMALARLHGLPTRLLDWTTNRYVAAYFSACEAMRGLYAWKPEQRLAIFEMNKGPHENEHCGRVRVLRIGGSISRNVVAQQGLFTVHAVTADKGSVPEAKSLEHYLSIAPPTPIRMLTVPVTECINLYDMCYGFGYNAARMFPNADGASQLALEEHNYFLAKERIKTGAVAARG